MSPLPRIIFDTSAINALEDGGLSSEPLMKALECGFEVTLTAMSADEIISNKTPERREALLSRFGRLLYPAQCFWPPHEIVRLQIAAHHSDPSGFGWRQVDVRARDYERAIPVRDFDDPLCVEQRKQQFAVQKQFDRMWSGLRTHLDAILAQNPSNRPTTYRAAVQIAALNGGVMWSFGQALYEHVAGAKPTETEIKQFMEACPPFRAACHSLVMAWYTGSLRTPDGKPTAGRNDLLMATYLPYCDRFITADWAQANELREIAVEAKIPCDVVLFKDFDRSFAIMA